MTLQHDENVLTALPRTTQTVLTGWTQTRVWMSCTVALHYGLMYLVALHQFTSNRMILAWLLALPATALCILHIIVRPRLHAPPDGPQFRLAAHGAPYVMAFTIVWGLSVLAMLVTSLVKGNMCPEVPLLTGSVIRWICTETRDVHLLVFSSEVPMLMFMGVLYGLAPREDALTSDSDSGGTAAKEVV